MNAQNKMDRESLEKVARFFGAFSDATRLAILMELKGEGGSMGVGELVDRVGGSQGNISKQLNLLYEHGLLNREKRGTKVFYSISDEIIYRLCGQVCEKLNSDTRNGSELIYHI